jgi:hypothetical protein
MVSVPGMSNEGTPLPGEPFVFPSYGNVGPLYIATLSLSSLTIGLPIWFFSTTVISNVGASDVSTLPTHQPHVDLSPSSLVRSPYISPSLPSESSQASIHIDKKKKKRKEKKKKNQKGTKPPTTSNVRSKQPATVNSIGSVDNVDKFKKKNLKPKFPCSLCKGDHFLRDCPGIPKLFKMWSSVSSAPAGHVGDTPSTSDVKVGKKKTIVKFPCMLCKGGHYSHLCPSMDEASSLLEKLQLPKGYGKLSPNPLLVDGLVNPVPSPVNPVDQVVNLVSSLVEPLAKVVDPVPSPISLGLHLRSESKVTDPVPSSKECQSGQSDSTIDRSHSSSNKCQSGCSGDFISQSHSSFDECQSGCSGDFIGQSHSSSDECQSGFSGDFIGQSHSSSDECQSGCSDYIIGQSHSSLMSAKVVALVTALVNPTLPFRSAKVVDSIPSSIDPTLPLESEPDSTHVFLVEIGSTMPGGIPLSSAKTLPSNEAILFYWGVLTGPRLPFHIPFKITVKVCGQDIPHALIDEGSSISILSSIA